MQITIDSKDPLTDVLRIIGTIYEVDLTSADTTLASRKASRSGGRSARDGRTTRASRGRKSTATTSDGNSAAGAKAMRQWARENGIAVSGRGALSASVRDAYLSAHQA